MNKRMLFTTIFLFISTLFVFVVSLLNAKNDATTFDEVAHIPAGYASLSKGDMRLNYEHPPLIKAIAAFPLLFLDLHFDTTKKYWTEDINGQWDAGREFLYNSGNNSDAMLFWSRAPIIFLSAAFGLFLFWWGKRWLGLMGGYITFILYTFDPNILGHNHFVTTDIGIAAFLTLFIYFFLEFIKTPSWKNAAIGGFFLGITHLVKFSSLMFLPVLFATLVLSPIFQKHDAKKKQPRWTLLLEYLGKGFFAFGFSIAVVWIFYAFLFSNTPPEISRKTINFEFPPTDTRPFAQETNAVLVALDNHSLTRPLGYYALGAARVFKRVAGGNDTYFMGNVSADASKIYFPTVFLLKETIPFLVLLLSSFALSIKTIFQSYRMRGKSLWTWCKKTFPLWMQKNTASYTILGCVLLYTFLSVFGNLNIGFRHLFPILPFLFLLAAKKITEAISALRGKKQSFLFGAIFLLLGGQIATALFSYPFYTSYFNAFAGGSENGYQYVADSNADWGQDLKRLKKWIDEYNMCQYQSSVNFESCALFNKYGKIEKIRIDYFGGGNILQTIGSDRTIFWWDHRRPIEPGWYALSVNFIQMSLYDVRRPDEKSYRWLKQYAPVARAGTSIQIYSIENPPSEE